MYKAKVRFRTYEKGHLFSDKEISYHPNWIPAGLVEKVLEEPKQPKQKEMKRKVLPSEPKKTKKKKSSKKKSFDFDNDGDVDEDDRSLAAKLLGSRRGKR